MNLQPFKRTQALTDFANVYNKTTAAFISCFYEFVSSIIDITKKDTLESFKYYVAFAIWHGCENGITSRSTVGANDVYGVLSFMRGSLQPSKKLTTDNFMSEDDVELLSKLDIGLNKILTELIEGTDERKLSKKQKEKMIKIINEYQLTPDEVKWF